MTARFPIVMRLWRGGEDIWYANPKTVPPTWFNYFSQKKQPVTLTISSERGEAEKEVVASSANATDIIITYTFDYNYDDFPTELTFYFTSQFESKEPFAAIRWITPDGRELRVADFGVNNKQTYRSSQDEKLKRRLGGIPPERLFADPNSDPENPVPLKGTYQVRIEGVAFEPDSDLNAEFVMGLAPVGLDAGRLPLGAIEKATILQTLEAAGGNKSETARRLGITGRTLHKKLKAYGVMK